ncbi:TetR/AcrR family transcriptional regulator [Actinokineospora sp. UTMC 2448]|uniref:TetR/AcrR family transcriptional regulator n=1 Tax=Actinokineospora sp. UTMC 2448 TaxID=2268449 RepID=UPI00216486C2|nr:TetR/AcrR family transcriptional regulator [Actinokineospora sp. UTMC 2448]UVS79675.1 Toluene efflux pump ttgABC operon repressor [Actinokineospora sp. UTMC 2448]
MTTSRATRRAETTQESRRLLVTAAAELFAERGYRLTTFEDIAARSGVSRGSIPWHFGNKEGLLAAVIDHVMASIRADARRLESGTFDDLLHGIVELTRGPTTKLFITLMAEAAEPDSPLRKWYGDVHTALRALGRSWIERSDLADGVDADALSAIVVGATMGIHQQWRIAPDAVDLDRVYATLGVLLRSVGLGEPG